MLVLARSSRDFESSKNEFEHRVFRTLEKRLNEQVLGAKSRNSNCEIRGWNPIQPAVLSHGPRREIFSLFTPLLIEKCTKTCIGIGLRFNHTLSGGSCIRQAGRPQTNHGSFSRQKGKCSVPTFPFLSKVGVVHDETHTEDRRECTMGTRASVMHQLSTGSRTCGVFRVKFTVIFAPGRSTLSQPILAALQRRGSTELPAAPPRAQSRNSACTRAKNQVVSRL